MTKTVYRIGYRDSAGKYHYLEAGDKTTMLDAVCWLLDAFDRVTVKKEERFTLEDSEDEC